MDVVYKELKKFSGSQFDPELVEVFIAARKKQEQEQANKKVIDLPKRKKAA